MPSEQVGARVRSLVKSYWTESEVVHALDGVDADFVPGRLTAVVGRSGSGKSTLLRVIAGLDRADSGSIMIGDRELTALRPRELRRLRRTFVGYVFQSPEHNFVSYLTVSEHLELERRTGRSALDPEEVLGAMGLAGKGDRLPNELSGGEQQRAAFAQVLMAEPALVVADEPTAELDQESGARLLEAIGDLTRRGVGVIVASHDHKLAEAADEVLHIEGGSVVTSHDQWRRR